MAADFQFTTFVNGESIMIVGGADVVFMPCCDEETSSLREGVFVLTGFLVGSLPDAVMGVTSSPSLTRPYSGTCLHRARLLAHAELWKGP